jgi:hypothetical protein
MVEPALAPWVVALEEASEAQSEAALVVASALVP